MDDTISEFLKRLYDEIIHHKEKRAVFVIQKFLSLAALFSLGFGTIGVYDFTSALFVVPFVSVALDIFISAEDYKIKRVGAFLRIYRYASDAERNWERFVNNHREPLAIWASLFITLISFITSGIVLFIHNKDGILKNSNSLWPAWIYYAWAGCSTAFIIAVFLYYRFLLKNLPSPHLLEHHIKALLALSEKDDVNTHLDKLMSALILNTGITYDELLSLKWEDLHHTLEDKGALLVRKNKSACERLIPYRDNKVVTDILSRCEELLGYPSGFIFAKRLRKKFFLVGNPIDDVLKKYPIVIEGNIYSVKAGELRTTYARNLFDDGDDINIIQSKLGCSDIKKVLGFIGPLEVLREERNQKKKISKPEFII